MTSCETRWSRYLITRQCRFLAAPRRFGGERFKGLLLTVTDLVQVAAEPEIPEDADCVVREEYASGIMRDPLALLENDRLLSVRFYFCSAYDKKPGGAEHSCRLSYLDAELGE